MNILKPRFSVKYPSVPFVCAFAPTTSPTRAIIVSRNFFIASLCLLLTPTNVGENDQSACNAYFNFCKSYSELPIFAEDWCSLHDAPASSVATAPTHLGAMERGERASDLLGAEDGEYRRDGVEVEYSLAPPFGWLVEAHHVYVLPSFVLHTLMFLLFRQPILWDMLSKGAFR